jgi:protein gp37
MGENSAIGWCDHTFNCWIGCTVVSEECSNCYAKMLAERYGWAKWGDKNPRYRTSEANWKKPLAWNRKAEKEGIRYKVFCASLADVLDSQVPHEWRSDLFSLIEQTPNLDWLLLTKRTESLVLMLPAEWLKNPRPNVWLGATVGHSKSKWRMDDLKEIPAVVHFLSCEPLLDDLGEMDLEGIEWVICGGESGPKHRPLNVDHARKLRDQCIAAGVPYFFKQHGGNRPESNGCELDGREWKQFPRAA